jgi:hypothetical protein
MSKDKKCNHGGEFSTLTLACGDSIRRCVSCGAVWLPGKIRKVKNVLSFDLVADDEEEGEQMSKDSETKTRDRNLEEIARLLGRPAQPKQVVIESALDRAGPLGPWYGTAQPRWLRAKRATPKGGA